MFQGMKENYQNTNRLEKGKSNGMINTLSEAREHKGILIAAHRGMVAGNIPHNTIPAFEAALNQGADILETDVTLSGDGVMFIFHPGKEWGHLNEKVHLEEMKACDIQKLRYINSCGAKTEYGLPTLDEFLETYKNRCLINLDHGWKAMEPMLKAIRRHHMEDQILVKTPGNPEYAKMMEQLAPDMMYMPILKEKDELTPVLETMGVNFVAAELVFERDDSPLVKQEYLEEHHKKGRLLWCNALLYNYKKQLSGSHIDDVAVVGDPDTGWGWLIEHGFDIIQTDWVMPLRQYISYHKCKQGL